MQFSRGDTAYSKDAFTSWGGHLGGSDASFNEKGECYDVDRHKGGNTIHRRCRAGGNEDSHVRLRLILGTGLPVREHTWRGSNSCGIRWRI